MRRPLILGLLLAANVINVVANAIIFDGYRHQVGHGLLPWVPVLASVGSLLSMAWLCVLVLRLPDVAAARLWPGFAAIGGTSLMTAASQWVLYRQYSDTVNFVHLVTSGSGFTSIQLNLPAYQPDSELVLLISALVTAAAWFGWAVLARREAVLLSREATAASAPVTQPPPSAAPEPQV